MGAGGLHFYSMQERYSIESSKSLNAVINVPTARYIGLRTHVREITAM